MAMGKAVVLALVMAAVALILTSSVEGAISCGAISQTLEPCRAYLNGPAGTPPAACCASVRAVNGMARTTPDQQQACRCIKSLAAAARPNLATAKSLPSKCGVNIGFAVDPAVDCSKVRRRIV